MTTGQLKIFCIGLSRTGTVSLCLALEKLGYATIHFPLGMFVFPEQVSSDLKFESKFVRGYLHNRRLRKEIEYYESKEGRNLINNYCAFGDLPIPSYFEHLDRKYPGSKFILTTRDEDKWLKSMNWLLTEGKIVWKRGQIENEILYQTYGTIKYDEKLLLNTFRNHNEKVIEYFINRSDIFLLLNIDKGELNYSKLCKFLQVDNPDEDFPKSNTPVVSTLNQKFDYYCYNNVPFYSKIKLFLK
jgi:hypothetical protein